MMPKFSTTRIVQHSAYNMFKLVADIEEYPEFLPLCKELEIIKQYKQDDKCIMLANMEIGYKFINESFCTEVTLCELEKIIKVKYIDGPFLYLNNKWEFKDIAENKSAVEFFIDYEFKSKMLGILMGEVFERAFIKFSSAFEARANILYRKKTG